MKISFGKPLINSKERSLIKKVLSGTQLVHGPFAEKFEKLFSEFLNVKYATTVSSCTAGMHLTLLANNIGTGDEVLLPALSHTATAHVVEYTGAKPVFVDVDQKTGNIDTTKIESKFTDRTKAIIIVHYLGLSCELDSIKKIAKERNVIIIEDCALALGGSFRNKSLGTYGMTGCFSFYPVKHITTAEGGMVITNNKKIFQKIKKLKAFGYNRSLHERKIPGIYDVDDLGFNYRMSELHAAIGISQLEKLPLFLKVRKRNFDYFSRKIKDNKNFVLFTNANRLINHAYYCLNLTIRKNINIDRSKFIKKLVSNGIGVSVHYPKALTMLKYYKDKYRFKKNDYPVSEWIANNTISFPIGPHISLSQIDYVIKIIEKIVGK